MGLKLLYWGMGFLINLLPKQALLISVDVLYNSTILYIYAAILSQKEDIMNEGWSCKISYTQNDFINVHNRNLRTNLRSPLHFFDGICVQGMGKTVFWYSVCCLTMYWYSLCCPTEFNYPFSPGSMHRIIALVCLGLHAASISL